MTPTGRGIRSHPLPVFCDGLLDGLDADSERVGHRGGCGGSGGVVDRGLPHVTSDLDQFSGLFGLVERAEGP
jgi:hypothetical protein